MDLTAPAIFEIGFVLLLAVAAGWLARRLGDGLLVDIGSTTTDIVPFLRSEVAARGSADAERLALLTVLGTQSLTR